MWGKHMALKAWNAGDSNYLDVLICKIAMSEDTNAMPNKDIYNFVIKKQNSPFFFF